MRNDAKRTVNDLVKRVHSTVKNGCGSDAVYVEEIDMTSAFIHYTNEDIIIKMRAKAHHDKKKGEVIRDFTFENIEEVCNFHDDSSHSTVKRLRKISDRNVNLLNKSPYTNILGTYLMRRFFENCRS